MSQYEELFEQYVSELTQAVAEEKERLDRIKEINRNEFQSKQDLESWVEAEFGSLATQGRVVAVFRKYWLKCDELNQLSEESGEIVEDEEDFIDYVNPRHFVVDWLEGAHDELYKVIDSMPYYPIRIDDNGFYC